MIKVAVAEDNDFLAESIKEKLSLFEGELKYKYRGRNGSHLLALLEEDANLDLILMDIEMPMMNGIKATEQIKLKYPHIKVIMLTVFDDEENIFNAIRAGADGYLLKDESPKVVFEGIKQMMNGGAPMSPAIAAKTLKLLRNPLADMAGQKSEDYELTKREVQVLEQLCTGLDYKSIGENLNISTGTVRKHIENIYSKLHVNNKVEAINKANRERLV
ncbi:response regulator transcription factor [Parvicella tangerina]|uniref:Transcriptional regulatory protein LnrK n=1 Tax=Parvicella tangerina TaxID=2829795 RepID=A0A916JKV5_9FLAO|nr:response regulator transcription factor [Parvicella tangerina]CAG5079457.1 Transcriptional regulatory protein LnrK [Parvicella tangerina]